MSGGVDGLAECPSRLPKRTPPRACFSPAQHFDAPPALAEGSYRKPVPVCRWHSDNDDQPVLTKSTLSFATNRRVLLFFSWCCWLFVAAH